MGRSCPEIALDQPRVAVELLVPTGTGPDDWGCVGPSMFNTFLLDTGANSVLAMATAVDDLSQPPYAWTTQGEFLEAGVAGDHEMDISVPYRFDFAGTRGICSTINDARILSDPNQDFSMFGPWGLAGMPAMVDRVTSDTPRSPRVVQRITTPVTLPISSTTRYTSGANGSNRRGRIAFLPAAHLDGLAYEDLPWTSRPPAIRR